MKTVTREMERVVNDDYFISFQNRRNTIEGNNYIVQFLFIFIRQIRGIYIERNTSYRNFIEQMEVVSEICNDIVKPKWFNTKEAQATCDVH